ncbi:MAG: YdcF family protein [Desulfobacteraceae bacterium]|jgi:uncharacterized SAM-binding protein YcdF (DUF218 family)
MFIFKKMIAPFLLPPGLFILILLMVGAWWWWKKKQRLALVFLGMAIIIWLPSMDPTADLLMGPLEANMPLSSNPDVDVIIMLGGATFSKVPDLSGTGAPGPGTMERLVTATRLQRRLHVPLIVSGGKVFADDGSVARVTQRFLIDLGIPPDKIYLENRSRDTYENALFSQKICQQHGFVTPLVVTSGYHLKRTMIAFNKIGMKIIPFPCALTTWSGKSYKWRNFLPSVAALYGTSAALHEWFGLLFYRIVY